MRIRPFATISIVLLLLELPGAQKQALAQGTDCQGCSPRVTVTPDGDYDINRAWNSTGNVTTFIATNETGSTSVFTFTCLSTGGVACTNITPGSQSLADGQWVTLTVTYSVGSTGGQIKARMENDLYSDEGFQVVTTPPNLILVAPAMTIGPDTALVHTRTPLVLVTYNADAPIDTATLVMKLGVDTVTTLARWNGKLAEWEIDAPHQLSPGVSTPLFVKICHVNGGCTSLTRQLKLDNSGAPIVSFTGMPLEGSTSGAEVETAFATPAYFSLGTARSAGLVYSTRQSYPRALVNVDLELTWPAGNPDQIKAILYDGIVRMDSLIVSSPVCQASTGRRCRVTLQADFSASSFPRAARKWLKVEVRVTSGATTKFTTDSVEAVLVDRRNSAYGSGWFLAGVMRVDSAGTDMLVVGPSGTATVLRGSGGTYLSPPGNRSRLLWTGSQWELGSAFSGCGFTAKVVFDVQGRETSIVDCTGNTTRLKYAAVDRVDSIMDPLNKRIALTYNGSLKLTTVADPGGRQSKVTVNASNQLVYDSLASPAANAATATFAYTTYGGNTLVLQSQSDALGQATTFSYDARRRPTQTTMPAVLPETGATPISAILTSRPQVLRGLDTLLSADSIFAHVRDARGFWGRSALNRWGQPLKSWDSLGTVLRASYSPAGLILWSEGKVADSSRVYSSYDALGRLVRRYRLRASADTVRLDSLVYDSTHHVIRQINPLNQATTFSYGTGGLVLSVTTPTGDTTNYQYAANGQLQQVRAPGQTGWTIYTYDASWKNLQMVTNAAGVVLDSSVYDSYGRQIESRRKLTVKLSGEPLLPDTMQWRRTLTAFDLFNRIDSVRYERTLNCAAPCSSPTWPNKPSQSAQYLRFSHYYDRLGRDTARVNPQGKRTRYSYDGLGRLRKRWPFADSAAVADSFRYDVAGNLRYQWTRRAYLIEHRYDARSRDTATIVPGVGTYLRAYAGPADQLTRAWISGYTDPIGGVNPEVRWSYNQSGFLIADTAQGTRATSHSYDRYGRDTSLTDALGTWRIRFDAVRGALDTIITPFSDTLQWTIDTRGRYVGPYILNGANPDFTVVPTWDNVGKLVGLQNTQTVNVGNWQTDQMMPDIDLQVLWTEQQGAGGAIVSAADSIAHDGWGRVSAITHRKNGVLLSSNNYTFDRDGNITPSGETRTFDAATTRLTQRGTSAFRYDRAGNLDTVTSGSPAWKYLYDALDRLVEVRQNGILVARYAYDVLGRRVVKRVYSGSNIGYLRMIYRDREVIGDADSSGILTIGYTRGLDTDNLLAVHRYTDGSDYYVIHDPLGSVRGLAKKDSTWAASWRYNAYGTIIDSAGSTPFGIRYRWTGREFDAETGLYFSRSRYYDPMSQRFTQEDVLGYGGGMNLYAYGDGNPVNGRDPSGTSKSDLFYSWDNLRARQQASIEAANSAGFTCYVDGMATTGMCGMLFQLLSDGGLRSSMQQIMIFAPWGPTDVLTNLEKGRQLNAYEKASFEACNWINCNSVRLFESSTFVLKDAAITLGYNIFFGSESTYPLLAHELTHVVQFRFLFGENLGAYSLAFLYLHVRYPDPYHAENLSLSKSFWSYNLEQQGQIVQDCYTFGPGSLACAISPF